VPALERKKRSRPGTMPKFDGRAEVRLVAICCNKPPGGRTRWAIRLLADESGRLQIVTSDCPETVRPVSKKTGLNIGNRNGSASPEKDRARFVAHMEKILDVYGESYDQEHPRICMDEASKQVTSDVQPALPMAPGQPRREGHHYGRQEVRAVFMFFDPLRGWRRVGSCENRTRVEWAEQVRRLLERDYPRAKLVTLVCDNLNTHGYRQLVGSV
jgi:hypothetical protein